MSTKAKLDIPLFFSALADETRLRLLNLMQDGEVCVCFFAGALDTNNPKISRHLAYLRRAGLVEGRRDGKWMHYRIQVPPEPTLAQVFESTMNMLASDPKMQAERRRFADFCCAPSAPVMIAGRARSEK